MPSRLCFIHRVKGEKRQSHSACSQPLFVFALFDVSLQVRNVWVLFVCEKSKHSMQVSLKPGKLNHVSSLHLFAAQQ